MNSDQYRQMDSHTLAQVLQDQAALVRLRQHLEEETAAKCRAFSQLDFLTRAFHALLTAARHVNDSDMLSREYEAWLEVLARAAEVAVLYPLPAAK